jgi:hypothetical protein
MARAILAGELKRSRSETRAGMAISRKVLALDIAVERAASWVCGLKRSFLQARMGQGGRE